MTMGTESTMHSSREESAQPSPSERPHTQPALQVNLQVTPPNLDNAPPPPASYPSLLGGAGHPGEKRIFYAGSTMGPNRMAPRCVAVTLVTEGECPVLPAHAAAAGPYHAQALGRPPGLCE